MVVTRTFSECATIDDEENTSVAPVADLKDGLHAIGLTSMIEECTITPKYMYVL